MTNPSDFGLEPRIAQMEKRGYQFMRVLDVLMPSIHAGIAFCMFKNPAGGYTISSLGFHIPEKCA